MLVLQLLNIRVCVTVIIQHGNGTEDANTSADKIAHDTLVLGLECQEDAKFSGNETEKIRASHCREAGRQSVCVRVLGKGLSFESFQDLRFELLVYVSTEEGIHAHQPAIKTTFSQIQIDLRKSCTFQQYEQVFLPKLQGHAAYRVLTHVLSRSLDHHPLVPAFAFGE